VAEYDLGLESAQVPNPGNDKKLNILRTTLRGGLKGGDTRTEQLPLTPRRAGQFAVRVTAMSGALQSQATFVITVAKANVSLNVQGPDKRYVGRPAEYKIIVKNEGDVDQTGVVIREKLPPELTFKLASNGGNYAGGGEVTWNLGTLRAGQEVALDLTAECQKAAVAAEVITSLTADGNVRQERSSKIQIDGIAAIRMEMHVLEQPVEVGKNAVYRMTLTNTGSAPAKKIDVKGTPSELLQAVRATGPTKETIAGKIFTFGTLDTLAPGQKAVFTFECQALKVGDARFKVEYTSELNPTPIYEEEPTILVAPLGNPVPAGPMGQPNAPPPGVVPPLPLPNSMPQSPSMVMNCPPVSRKSRNFPVEGS